MAESLGRAWISIDERRDYAALSAARFLDACSDDVVRRAVQVMEAGERLDLGELRRDAGLDRQQALAL